MQHYQPSPWSPGTPIQDLPGALPPDTVPAAVDLAPFPARAVAALSSLQNEGLVEYALWLDMQAKADGLRTHSNSKRTRGIVEAWAASRALFDVKARPSASVVRLVGSSWVVVNVTFKVRRGRLVGVGSGFVGFTLEMDEERQKEGGGGRDLGGEWKVWLITTVLENFEGWGHPDRPPLLPGPAKGKSVSRPAWTRELITAAPAPESSHNHHNHHHVVIVGGGQAGLSLAARLQALGIDYVILEKAHVPGHRWVSRYDAVRQHTVREVNNLPFGSTWDAHEEEFLLGDRVAEGFRRFVDRWGIRLRTGVEVVGCTRDGDGQGQGQGQWKVQVKGSEEVLTARHLVFALGVGLGSARRPHWAGEEQFKGTLMHMVDFKNSAAWKGLRGAVVGSGTAGHDIAQDMLDHGLRDVTTVQRSVTAVYPMDWYAGLSRGMYRVGVPNEGPDRIAFAMPQKVAGEIQRRSYDAYVAKHRDYFERLERVGFRTGLGDGVDRIPNEIVLNHFGGYYIDIGTSGRIADGDIRVVNGVIDRFTADGLLVQGKKVLADVVVLATGYEPDYRKDLEPILGPLARTLPVFWGLSDEGDIRGLTEESGKSQSAGFFACACGCVLTQTAPGLWLFGGAAAHARFYSRFIALQIQEQMLMLRKDSRM